MRALWILIFAYSLALPISAIAQSRQDFLMAPSILSSYLMRDQSIPEILSDIKGDPVISKILDDVETSGVTIELNDGDYSEVEKANSAKVQADNPFRVALNILISKSDEVFQFKRVLESSRSSATPKYKMTVKVPNAKLGRLDFERASIVFDKVIRMTIFEEFFHAIEFKLREKYGFFFVSSVNEWIKENDLPVLHGVTRQGVESWMKNYSIGSTREYFNQIEKNSGISVNDFDKLPELTIYLVAKQFFSEWLLDDKFHDWFAGNYPEIRNENSHILHAISVRRSRSSACERLLFVGTPSISSFRIKSN